MVFYSFKFMSKNLTIGVIIIQNKQLSNVNSVKCYNEHLQPFTYF